MTTENGVEKVREARLNIEKLRSRMIIDVDAVIDRLQRNGKVIVPEKWLSWNAAELRTAIRGVFGAGSYISYRLKQDSSQRFIGLKASIERGAVRIHVADDWEREEFIDSS